MNRGRALAVMLVGVVLASAVLWWRESAAPPPHPAVAPPTAAPATSSEAPKRAAGQVLAGLLLDSAGKAAEGLAVTATLNGERQAVTTDGTGAFVFAELHEGLWMLEAEQQGSAAREPVWLPATGDVRDLTLRMSRRVKRRWIVVDERGAPVAGARVHDLGDDPQGTGCVPADKGLTDTRGELEVWTSANDVGCLTVSKPLSLLVSLDEREDVVLVVMTAAAFIDGEVLTDGKLFMGNAYVHSTCTSFPLAADGGPAQDGDARAEVDGGTFRLTVRPGTHSIEVATPGFLRARVTAAAPGAVSVRLEPGAQLEGRVLDLRGAGVANAAISLSARTNSSINSTTDPAGRFQVRGLREGAFSLTASFIDDQLGQISLSREVTTGTWVEVRPALGQPLRGVVAWVDGGVVAGATVEAQTSSGERRTTTTDDEGRFHFEHLEVATTHLSVSAPSSKRAALRLEPPWPEPTIRVDRELRRTCSGQVVDPQGREVRHFELDGQAVDAPDGRFEVTPARPVTLAVPGFVSRVVSACAGTEPNADAGVIVVRRGQVLAGVVVDGVSHRAVSRARVAVHEPEQTFEVQVDALGGFSTRVHDRAATTLEFWALGYEDVWLAASALTDEGTVTLWPVAPAPGPADDQ
jgi:hypothetical protein